MNELCVFRETTVFLYGLMYVHIYRNISLLIFQYAITEAYI